MPEQHRPSDEEILDELQTPPLVAAARFAKENKDQIFNKGFAALKFGIPALFAIGVADKGIDLVQKQLAYSRADEITERLVHGAVPDPNTANDFSGVQVQFACAPVPAPVAFPFDDELAFDNDEFVWAPIEVSRYLSPQELIDMGVEYKKNESKGVSEAKAGLGTMITYIPPSLTDALFYQTYPQPVEGPEISGVVVDTMTIRPDRNALTSGTLTFGHVGIDGKLVQYYLMNGNQLACSGWAEPDSSPRMVDATLQLRGPELNLKHFLGEEPLYINQFYKEEFDEFNLGEWYEANYPSLVVLLDAGLREASQKLVPRSELQRHVDYFSKRKFEKRLLSLLNFAKEQNLTEEEMKALQESIRMKWMPGLQVSDKELLSKLQANGVALPGRISIRPGINPKRADHTVTHELFHALVQGSEYTANENETTRDEMMGDHFWQEGVTELLVQISNDTLNLSPSSLEHNTEQIAYWPRVQLVHYLAGRGFFGDLVEHYTYSPSRKLAPFQEEYLAKWDVEVPNADTQQHIYAVIFDACGIEDRTDLSDRKKRTAAQEIFTELNALRKLKNEGEERIEISKRAERILESLKSLE